MKLTDKQKDMIRKELSGDENTLLYFIRQDILKRLREFALDEEDLVYLERLERYFREPSYNIADREVDSIILSFEAEIIWVWRAIRKHIIRYEYDDDDYDLEFDKEAILKDIDEAVDEYLKKLEKEDEQAGID